MVNNKIEQDINNEELTKDINSLKWFNKGLEHEHDILINKSPKLYYEDGYTNTINYQNLNRLYLSWCHNNNPTIHDKHGVLEFIKFIGSELEKNR